MLKCHIMVEKNKRVCPVCGGELKYYDNVERTVRTKNGIKKKMLLKRFRCLGCGKIHREIPKFIIPYKEYEKEIIIGVLDELITPETLGYEDYPCEMTMKRWKNEYKKKETSMVSIRENNL